MNNEEIIEDSERTIHFDNIWKDAKTVQVPVDNKMQPRYFSITTKSNTELDHLVVKELDINSMEQTGLWYNPLNSRILAYKLKREAETGRDLSGSDPKDREFIQDTLLGNKFYSSQATENLEKELKEIGQRDPAIISADGVIWNANRRVAIRQKLFKQTGDPKWNKVECVRLPSMSLRQLKQLEHRLQMNKEFREDYGSINLRLRCREATKAHGREKWSMNELLNSLQNRYTEKQVTKFIEEINLIDEYLEFIHCPSDYLLVEQTTKGGGVEIFTALNAQLEWEKNSNQTKDSDIEKIKYLGFTYVHHPKTIYNNIRDFRNILRNEITRENLLKNSESYQKADEYFIPGPDQSPASLKDEMLTKEFENLKAETSVYESINKSPAEVSNEILKKLQTIKLDKIDSYDKEFEDNILGIVERIEVLISKCSFEKQQEERFTDILQKLAKKFGCELQDN